MANKYVYKRASLTVTLPDGTKKCLRFTGKTQADANKKRDRAQAEYDAGLLIINTKTTLIRWYEEWLDVYKKPKTQDSTVKEIEGIFRRVFLPNIGAMALSDLRPIHIQRCLNELMGKSEKYIHKCHVYIADCINKIPEGTLRYNPLKGLEEPKGKKTQPRRPLTTQERELFETAIVTHHKGSFFGIMYACGLRPQEARALPVFGVDLKSKRLKITQAVEANTRRSIKDPKTEAGGRVIPIPDWYLPLLSTAVNNAIKNGYSYVFGDTKGGVLCESRMYGSWGSLKRQMDIAAGAKVYRNKIIMHALPQDLDPYNLRHTYCTKLAESGVDLKTAQYLMGHKDIRVTAEIYTHVTNSMLDNAEAKINGKNKENGNEVANTYKIRL